MSNKPNPLYLTWERETLGCYVSGHPVDLHIDEAYGCCTHSVSDLANCEHKQPVVVMGVVAMKEYGKTGGDERFAKWSTEDKGGAIDSMAWPKQCEKWDNQIRDNKVVVIRGKVTVRGHWRTLIADEVWSPAHYVLKYPPHAVVQVDDVETINSIMTIPYMEPGGSRLVVMHNDGAAQTLGTIRLTEAVYAGLRGIAGHGNVKIVTFPPSHGRSK